MQKCILIIENVWEHLDFISSNLMNEGYRVIKARNGSAALEYVKQIPDLIILDMMLPDMNGLDIVRELKRTPTTSTIPIFILTSIGTETNEIISLKVGSDDFIVKPVQIHRLLARIRAIFRQRERVQSALSNEEVISIDGLEVRIPEYTISYGDTTLLLPPKEFEILALLFRHRGRVLTRKAISRVVKGSSINGVSRSLDVLIGRIRRKLGRYAYLIVTVRGIGYRCHIP